MTDVIKTLYKGPEAFAGMVCAAETDAIIARRNELLVLLREGTDIPAMEETRQHIRKARKELHTLGARIKMGQSALWDWEHAITNRSYELTKEDAA